MAHNRTENSQSDQLSVKTEYIKICPSILAGDFARIGEEAKRVEAAGADYLHVDVMDGQFVPNLTIGPQVVAAINRSTSIFLDVHIMVYHPHDYIERMVEAGADMITFHFEATEDVEDTINFIRRCGVKAGVAFCPETSMTMAPKYAHLCDMILMMTVKPGFGGQAFMPEVLEKISFLREYCNRYHIRQEGVTIDPNDPKQAHLPPFDIQVDGGINQESAKLCFDAGANLFVAGTHLFKSPDMSKSIQELKDL